MKKAQGFSSYCSLIYTRKGTLAGVLFSCYYLVMAWVVKIGVEPSMTESEKQNNAYIIWSFFAPRGYTIEAVSGLLGNMDQESQINPGCKETSSDSSGWGLIQWTPANNYFWWFQFHGWDFFDGDAQCEKIAEEIESSRDPWIPTSAYPYSGHEWMALTNIEEATRAYFAERERGDPAYANMNYRISRANYWYNYLSGQPTPPTPPTPTPTNYLYPIIANMFMNWLNINRRK